MLPKRQRFTTQGFPNGKFRERHTFVWGTVVQYPTTTPQAAVVVSKKVFGRAVDRNRVRRRVYAALKGALTHTPHALVVYVRREIADTSHATIVSDLHKVTVQ